MGLGTPQWILDADAHVSEAEDLWTSRVPAKWRDLVPQVRVNDKLGGLRSWYIGDTHLTPIGSTATAGYPEPFPGMPTDYEDAVAGAYDAEARLVYMDEQGIWAQVLYPNVGGFGNQAFLELGDPELKLACVRAYNDWITEWCSADADRLLAVTATPFWDIEATVAEIERCADLGHRGILFTAEPHRFGEPYLGDPHWDPLWRISEETGLPVSFHIGSANFLGAFTTDKFRVHGVTPTVAAEGVKLFLGNAEQVSDLLFSGVLQNHPDLRLISVESGIGWMPFVAEAADYMFTATAVSRERPGWELPSHYLREQVFGTVWFEDVGSNLLLDRIGSDNVLFETDYPHPACLYGGIQEKADRVFSAHGDDVRAKVLFDNAARLYGVDRPVAALSG